MENFWNNLKGTVSEATVNAAMKAVIAVVMLIVGFAVIKWIMRILSKERLSKNFDPGVVSFVRSFLSIGLKALLIITLASWLGVPMTSILALIGSAGLAIGLALQGSLSNFAGGLMILLFKPFKVGDHIEIPGKDSGVVEDISIFYTTLQTFDNTRIVIPNGTVSNSELRNFSSMATRRVDLDFSVEYAADIETVRSILLGVAEHHPKVLAAPAPFARVKELAESAVVFTLKAWCATGDYWDVQFDLREQVKKAFDQKGIAIPFPQLQLHTCASEKD